MEPALSDLRELLRVRKESGQALRYPEGVPPVQRIMEVRLTSPTSADITACVIDDAQLINVTSGQILDGTVVSRTYLARLTLTSGSWKIQSTEQLSSTNGSDGCAG